MASLKRWLDLRKNPWKAPAHKAMKAWKRESPANRLLYTYDDLPENAVVLDVGGYEGGWSDVVLASCPAAQIHIFEPHPGFAAKLGVKFGGNDKIHVHDFAIGSAAGELSLSDSADASTAFAGPAGAELTAEVRPVADFFDAADLGNIDLMKINIEGGEYDLLPGLVEAELVARVDRLQIQFHLFDPSWSALRDAIREQLAKTHDCLWCYPFVWEEWRRKTA